MANQWLIFTLELFDDYKKTFKQY